MSVRTLATVARTARRRREADLAYRQAIADARADGALLREIAAAAGVTHRAIDYLLKTTPKGDA